MTMMNHSTDSVSQLWQAVLGAKFRLVPNPDRHYCAVIDENGQRIGSASDLIYGSRGYSVDTPAYGGFVSADQVVFIDHV